MPRFTPRAEALEAKLVLSAGSLTPAEYQVARVRIVQAAQQLEATGNVARADAALARAVRTIPGGADLLPALRAEVADGEAPARDLLGGLDAFIRERVAAGEFVLVGSLRKTLAPPATGTPPPPTPPAPPAPVSPAPVPASFAVNIANATTSRIDVRFTQVVDGVRTELTGTSIGSGVTARYVPVITRNSSPITVSFRSPTLGYWEFAAPAHFSQLRLAYYSGRGQFFFGG